jgi:hypothetical protein
MKISKTQQRFSEELKEPRSLTNPEDYLGPNWQDVINFWLYVDGLSYEEKYKMNKCYWALDRDVRIGACCSSRDAAKEVVGKKVRDASWYATYDVSDWYIFQYATNELIAQHKLLEQGKTLVFLPLCIKNKTRLQRLLSSIKQFLNL